MSRISSRELTEWQAYNQFDPLDHQERADWRAAMLAALLAEINRNKKKRRKPYTAQDFMPEYKPTRSGNGQQTPNQMLALVEIWNAAFGGKDLR